MSHTLRNSPRSALHARLRSAVQSLLLLSFLGLIVGALWLSAWASADTGQVIIRGEPLARGVTLESTHPAPYLSSRSVPARPQIF